MFDDAHSDSDEYPQLWRSGVVFSHSTTNTTRRPSMICVSVIEQFREIGENLVAFLAHGRKLLPAR